MNTWKANTTIKQHVTFKRRLGKKHFVKHIVAKGLGKAFIVAAVLAFFLIIFALASTNDLNVCLKTAMCTK